MARNYPKKALYEVIGKSRFKSGGEGAIEQLHPEKAGQTPAVAEDFAPPSAGAFRWLKRPKMMQFNAGRIELSMPYQLAVAILLAVILLFLVVFRLGQITYPGGQKVGLPKIVQSQAGRLPAAVKQPAEPVKKTAAESPRPAAADKVEQVEAKAAPAQQKGDHRIVITQYQVERDLEPVRKYFAEKGIAAVIEKRGSRFYLVTENTYENPEKNGTDGNAAKKKIIETGAGYKAPQGYESFAPKLFSDAYGEKIR